MKIKWIVGYVDSHGAVHYKKVNVGDLIDSHNQIWPGPKQTKWRWIPSFPKHLNTYGNKLDIEDEDRIWKIIDKESK